MVQNDKQIRDLVFADFPMITPFVEQLVRKDNEKKVLSYGISSYGYDVRLTDEPEEVKIFHNLNGSVIDPKRFDASNLLISAKIQKDEDGALFVILPPSSYLLGKTVEYFRIPRDIQVIAIGKSTYARSGVLINCTPIEAGFEGHVVIEVANSTPSPVRIYLMEGIAQFIFFKGEPCENSYSDRNFKYQGQTGLQLPLV